MGQTASVTATASRTTHTSRPLKFKVDIILVLSVFILIVLGLLFVYSASWKFTYDNLKPVGFVLKKQIIFAISGGMIAWIISRIDYHYFERWVLLAMLGTLGLLAGVFLFGTRVDGVPTRTLLGGSVQPSELAKLVTVLYLSVWLYRKKDVINSFSLGLLPLLAIVGITGGLIFKQPDLSAAMTVVVLGATLFFLAGSNIRQVLTITAFIILLGILVATVSDTGHQRIMDYWRGLFSLQDASDHVLYSMQAVARGGIFGVGIGEGSLKYMGLPFAWTDSIFAVIAEEAGLLGAFGVLGLFLIITWRGLRIAQNAPDMLGRLIASGITIWIAFEALVNIGVLVTVFPFAGNALPLLSAGGSSMITTLTGVGILLNINRQGKRIEESKEEKIFSAVVDLRRGNRRRSVSRRSGSSGSRR